MLDIIQHFKSAKKAGKQLLTNSPETINQVLRHLADALVARIPEILAANALDAELMPNTDPRYDRLLLTAERLQAIADDLCNVAALPSALGKLIEEKTLANGLYLQKVSVPLGVVGVIYEARPNVTVDVFALCLKSGNVCVLKGGSDAQHSNKILVQVIKDVLQHLNLPTEWVYLLPPSREAASVLLNATEYVDVIIPRGSQALIDFVRQNARVPVIETGAGIVHTYFDESGDLQKATDIVCNAKTRRVSVCNALDCLLIQENRLSDLPALVQPLARTEVVIFADKKAFEVLEKNYPAYLLKRAEPKHFGTEFLSLQMAIKTVGGLQEALDHIDLYGSKHSEAIVAENAQTIEFFLLNVDAAAVYANASTAFTDGGQFGMGAEIGISTQKLHARGPMALPELTSYKWLIRGDGHTR